MLFDPTSYSAEKIARLEELLVKAEAAAESRRRFMFAGSVLAMNEWLDHPATRLVELHNLETMRAYADDRVAALVNQTEKHFAHVPGGLKTFARIQSLSVDEQKHVFAFIAARNFDYVDRGQSRKHWSEVNAAFEDIHREFPEIIMTQRDLDSAHHLGAVVEEAKGALGQEWLRATAQDKVKICFLLLKSAFPIDDVDHLQMAIVGAKKSGASFSGSMTTDIICLGPAFAERKDFVMAMYFIAHEYQHRKQAMLMEALEKGKIAVGSAEYYQARLFKANLSSYLSATNVENALASLARVRDYMEQPVEEQANEFSEIAGQKFMPQGFIAAIKKTTNITKFFCDAVKPLDALFNGTRYNVLSALRPKVDLS